MGRKEGGTIGSFSSAVGTIKLRPLSPAELHSPCISNTNEHRVEGRESHAELLGMTKNPGL